MRRDLLNAAETDCISLYYTGGSQSESADPPGEAFGKTSSKNWRPGTAGRSTLSCAHSSSGAVTDTRAASSAAAEHNQGPAERADRGQSCSTRNRRHDTLCPAGLRTGGSRNGGNGFGNSADRGPARCASWRHDIARQLRRTNSDADRQDTPSVLPYGADRRLIRLAKTSFRGTRPDMPALFAG